MTVYLAVDTRKGRRVMLCAECLKDDPTCDYRYAEHHGEPEPISYEDAVDHLEGRTPVCDSCSEEIER